MSVKLFIPDDAAALSVGADKVAGALAKEAERLGIDLHIVRNGSRGMLWLEPLVEWDGPDGRMAFGPVHPGDAAALLAAILGDGRHLLALGPTEEIPYLKHQERLTLARGGLIDPHSLADYSTVQGEQRTVALPDGSMVYLNTDTAIAVVYGDDERWVELLRGEALFQVASNPDRPFRVIAEGGMTEAVGTAFVIREDPVDTVVTVTEGVVEVRSPLGGAGPEASVRAERGQQTRYRTDAPPGVWCECPDRGLLARDSADHRRWGRGRNTYIAWLRPASSLSLARLYPCRLRR